ncbi:hypothetical protein T440DRAFT_551441 [Plenodomus tracheiphilus IPT5]|uniref:Transcription factor domain-containing protein n=1 Tax=Plenodomus tracheiphilus IPT5 TaxID=1408161 RepID=A0A6A7BK93_9PLEO|nr:hypothetical protein T440DRAFT_551441 [Plenodomus tracheiphilus IPT5]
MDYQGGDRSQVINDQNVSREELGQRQMDAEKPFNSTSMTFPFTPGATPQDTQQSPESPQTIPRSKTPVEITHLSPSAISLTSEEALLYHHYNVHLGRWMDCTNASRLLTLRVAEMARRRPVLHHAVICFAARHRGDDKIAEGAYQRCIPLLINRLNQDPTNDETLLTAVIILHFADQLSVRSTSGLCDKSHLSGSSSILRASQKTRFIDPSAPTVREAIFWVYVRQSLYNASIRQQPLDLDFSLQIQPLPEAVKVTHPLDWLRLETAWANQMLWHTACVANFCFSDHGAQSGRPESAQRWQELWVHVQKWRESRPSSFDPIWTGPSTDESVFADIFFTADWHVISFTFYHFASMLLLTYKPGPRFGMRIVQSEESRLEILKHAEAICSASKSSPQNVQLLIIMSHTVFVWGPLLSNSTKRGEVIHLLESFEKYHNWSTKWITNLLQAEWNGA